MSFPSILANQLHCCNWPNRGSVAGSNCVNVETPSHSQSNNVTRLCVDRNRSELAFKITIHVRRVAPDFNPVLLASHQDVWLPTTDTTCVNSFFEAESRIVR